MDDHINKKELRKFCIHLATYHRVLRQYSNTLPPVLNSILNSVTGIDNSVYYLKEKHKDEIEEILEKLESFQRDSKVIMGQFDRIVGSKIQEMMETGDYYLDPENVDWWENYDSEDVDNIEDSINDVKTLLDVDAINDSINLLFKSLVSDQKVSEWSVNVCDKIDEIVNFVLQECYELKNPVIVPAVFSVGLHSMVKGNLPKHIDDFFDKLDEN